MRREIEPEDRYDYITHSPQLSTKQWTDTVRGNKVSIFRGKWRAYERVVDSKARASVVKLYFAIHKNYFKVEGIHLTFVLRGKKNQNGLSKTINRDGNDQ